MNAVSNLVKDRSGDVALIGAAVGEEFEPIQSSGAREATERRRVKNYAGQAMGSEIAGSLDGYTVRIRKISRAGGATE